MQFLNLSVLWRCLCSKNKKKIRKLKVKRWSLKALQEPQSIILNVEFFVIIIITKNTFFYFLPYWSNFQQYFIAWNKKLHWIFFFLFFSSSLSFSTEMSKCDCYAESEVIEMNYWMKNTSKILCRWIKIMSWNVNEDDFSKSYVRLS